MHLAELPAEREYVRRYVEELWYPYNEDLAEVVPYHELAEDADFVPEETEFRLDRMEEEDHRVWVAVDGDEEAGLDGEWVGYVTTGVDACPAVFEYHDRLVIGDIWVRADHRGTGLAETLVERAAEDARAAGCPEVRLDVDVGNERAIAFYEKLGFSPYRYRMNVATEDL